MRSAWTVAATCLTLVACGWDVFVVTPGGGGAGGSGGTGGAAGHAGGQGGEGAGGDGVGACSQADLVATTFDDVSNPDPRFELYTTGQMTADVVGGTLVLDGNGTHLNYGEANLSARVHYDMRGSALSVEVTEVVATDTNEARFILERNAGNFAGIEVSDGMIYARIAVGGSGMDVGAVPYDAALHRHWRLREADSVLHFEVSADGASWTELTQRSTDAMFSMAAVRPRFVLDNDASPPVALRAVVSEIRHEGPAPGVYCPVSSLSDDFADGTPLDTWLGSVGSTDTLSTEGGGALHITLESDAGTSSNYNYYGSTYGYDLTEGAISVELRADGGPEVDTYFELWASPMTVAFYVTDDADLGRVLRARYGNLAADTTTLRETPYDPVAHRFLRLRHVDNEIRWETSPDGTTWPASPSDPGFFAGHSPADLNAVYAGLKVLVGADENGTETPGPVTFANLNITPE